MKGIDHVCRDANPPDLYPGAVAQKALRPAFASSWGDRLFGAVPVAPVWVGLALAGTWLCALLVFSSATGLLDILRRMDMPIWEVRNARLPVLFVLLAAYLPTACRYVRVGAAKFLEELRPSLDLEAPALERIRSDFDRLDPARRRLTASLAVALVPTIALLIDRDPMLYFQTGYWGPATFSNWALGSLVMWNLGVFVYLTGVYARRFSDLAGSVNRIDLFDLAPLAPFGRLGLRSALLWLILFSLFALNGVDAGFYWLLGVLGTLGLAAASLSLALPVRGVHRRVRAEKLEEMDRIHRALRGEPGALSASPIAKWSGTATLADLVAYRSLVESVREWPLDPSTLLRFVLFLGIPVASWFGGALMERLVEAALD